MVTTDDPQDMEKRKLRGEKWGFGPALSLGTAVRLTMGGWNTTTCNVKDQPTTERGLEQLGGQVKTEGWATTQDHDGTHGARSPASAAKRGSRCLQLDSLKALGPTTGLFRVLTGRRAVLAPEFSLWLMGFPEAWAALAPGAKDWQEAQAALELECSKALETQSSQSLPQSS